MYYLSGMLRTHRFRTISFRLLRLTVLLVVPALCILTFEGVCKAQEAERISAFVSNIEVRADGSLVVKETILTHSVGEQIRHGIYRAFVARNGRPALRLTLLDARLDGNRIENRTETTDRQVRVYLGRPDSRLAPGDHVFEISYHTERVVDLTGSRARLYWNVTGDEWSFPIDSVESVISFPPGTVLDETVVSAYTGAYGSIEGRYWYKWTKDESVSQSKRLRLWTDSLQPQEGLTVHVTWPANSLSYRWKIAALFINDRFVGYGALGLAVLLLYWAVSWFFYGRDPEQGTITDRSTPPEQISAAGIRYLLQMFPDNKTFTTAVVSLGSKGFLQVIAEDDDYTVVRKRSDLHGLPLEERELAKVLFGSKERVSLRMDSRRIRKSLEAFRKGLEKNYRKYFVINRRFILPAALISAVGLGSTLWVALEGKSRVHAVLTLVGVLILLLLFRMLHRLWPDSIQELRRRRAASLSPEGPLDEGDGILPTVIVFIAVVLFAGVIATITGTAWIMLLLIYLAVNLLFTNLIKAPTIEGQRLLDEIEGFRRYLQQSAASQNEAEDPAARSLLFDRYSTYALAFDMEDSWMFRVAGAIDDSIQPSEEFCPDWYQGQGFDRFYLRSGRFGYVVGSWALAGYRNVSTTGQWTGSGGGGGRSGGSGGSGGGGGFAGGGAGTGGGGGW